jgi:hypothetical protein
MSEVNQNRMMSNGRHGNRTVEFLSFATPVLVYTHLFNVSFICIQNFDSEITFKVISFRTEMR